MSYSRRQLEALGEPLGTSVTYLKPGGRVYGSGGGSSGSPSTQTQILELPEWARGYAQDTLAKAQAATSQPYQTYGAERIAGFSPLQQQAQEAAGKMGVAGQLGQATGLAGNVGATTFGTPQAQQYMSPYLEAALAPQLREAARTSGMQGLQQQAEAVGRGAFGGTRDALMRAERERNLNMQLGDIRARGFQTAFEQAGNLYNQDLNRQLQAAGVLGQLGQTQYGQQMGINQLQQQVGAQQQALRQQGLTQEYQDFLNQQNYPYKQLGFMSDMIRGLPLGQQSSRQMYEGSPGLVQSIGSLGLGAAGLSKLGGFFKEGGAVKLAEGGYAEISEKVRTDPTKYSPEQIRQAVKKGILDAKTAEAALDQIAKAKKAMAGIDALPSGLPTQGYAPGGIVAFDDGGEVPRYQTGGVMYQGKRWEDLQPYRTPAAGGLSELVGNVFSRDDLRIDPVTNEPISFGEFLRRQEFDAQRARLEPSASQAAAIAPNTAQPPVADTNPAGAGEGYFGGIGGGSPATAGPAAASNITMDRILERAQAAGERAVPSGIASLSMPTYTAAQIREQYQKAMPKGIAASENALTPEYQALEMQRRSAAEEAFGESQKISGRMDKLREAQAARFQAKEKDINADRDRSVGIAFLEAAQAMATPGQSLVRSLVTSGATGAKSFMASKERLDKRADDLSDAISRLDEARVGDERERSAAKANFNQALLNARTDMIRHRETAYGENRADAKQAVDTALTRDAAAANFRLQQQKAVLDAQQGAEANVIRAAGVGVQAQAVEADRQRAMRPGPQLELVQAISQDPKLADAYRQMHPVERKNVMDYYAAWMDKAGPTVQSMTPEQRVAAFMAEYSALTGMRGASVSSKPTGNVLNQPSR
jgi:hypothetical protein